VTIDLPWFSPPTHTHTQTDYIDRILICNRNAVSTQGVGLYTGPATSSNNNAIMGYAIHPGKKHQ